MIAEPTTTLTDYALAALGAALAFRLHAEAPVRPGFARLWAASFDAIALAALLGGTSHGFAASLPAGARLGLWIGTYALLGLANLLLLCAALAGLKPGVRTSFVAAALVKFAAYLVFAVSRRDFGWVIVDMALTLAGLLGLGLHRWFARQPAAGWLLAAVSVSFAGALVQYSRLAVHRHFNHNDLFHVVQMLALCLFYRAARSGARPRDTAGGQLRG